MNENVEMTKKQFIGWIFSSLMLATLIRLIVKAILDVDSAIVYVSGIIKYGGLVGSAIALGYGLSGLGLALQSETEEEVKYHVRQFVTCTPVCEWCVVSDSISFGLCGVQLLRYVSD